jgi:C-terminal processing protease CtpA/Prc
MVSGGGGLLHLHVGGGAALGDVNVVTWEDLRPGLTRLQQLITQAPADLDGDVRLDLLVTMGVTDALDRHSRVLYGDRLDAFDKRLKGVFYGVGARIVLNPQGELFVEEVFRGNPAESAGLRAGDTLVRIDGVSTTGMSVEDATKRITGPLGSSVELRVRRPLAPRRA